VAYFQKIVGERIYLSPMDRDDAPVFARWMNDPAVSGFLGAHGSVFTLEAMQKELAAIDEQGNNFAIVLRQGDVVLGNIRLFDLNQRARRATLGIFIGEAEHRGKGYGTEAIRLILDYGFATLNLHNIMLGVHADNARALSCYQTVGFRECGRRREATFKNGGYVDVVEMDILDREWRS